MDAGHGSELASSPKVLLFWKNSPVGFRTRAVGRDILSLVHAIKVSVITDTVEILHEFTL
jgi:hypothetical protein